MGGAWERWQGQEASTSVPSSGLGPHIREAPLRPRANWLTPANRRPTSFLNRFLTCWERDLCVRRSRASKSRAWEARWQTGSTDESELKVRIRWEDGGVSHRGKRVSQHGPHGNESSATGWDSRLLVAGAGLRIQSGLLITAGTTEDVWSSFSQ